MRNNILSLNNNKNIDIEKRPNKFYIEALSLKNFRNHNNLNLITSKSSLLIYGDNGCGKTNVLEAISLLSQGRGLRKAKVEDYIYQNELIKGNTKFWGVNAEYTSPEGKTNIGTGPRENLQSKSRVVRVNSENCSQIELGKLLKMSWITPQMCILFQSGMSERRRFIDRLTYSLDSLHISRVYKYEKLLRQRSNIILQSNIDNTWLSTVENQIAELTVSIVASRLDLTQSLNNLFDQEQKEKVRIDNFPPVKINLKGEIENLLQIKPALEVEGYVKSTLKKSRFSEDFPFCGPHNTKIEIFNCQNNKNVDFASTGEQKLILISIILSHARMINFKFNLAPILLLDDIVEHLDEKHRKALFLEVTRHCAQSWFTSTSKSAFEDYPDKIDKIYLPAVMNDFKGYYDYKNGEI